MRPSPVPERNARRLLWCYPVAWRTRYGEEFLELLESELADHGLSWRLVADVACSGTRARLPGAGWRATSPPSVARARAGLCVLGCAGAAFLLFAATLWSQLSIGWRWVKPSGTTTAAMLLMTGALFSLLAVTAVAVIILVACTWRALIGQRVRALALPALMFLAGTSVFVTGARHFANGWPGTGGHPWPGQGLVPPGLAAFAWASTLSVTSYWAHPLDLMAFPVPEVWWMALSPLALVVAAVGAGLSVRRLELSRRVLHLANRLASVASFAMLVFLLGAWLWILASTSRAGLFHAGAIDVAGGVVMALALAAARRAAGAARSWELVLVS